MKPLLDEIAEALIAADCGDYKTKPMHLYRPLAQAAIDVVERRILSDDAVGIALKEYQYEKDHLRSEKYSMACAIRAVLYTIKEGTDNAR